MIINYGAYCADSLDKNYIPLVLKYLELYILTHSLDDVLSELSKNSNKKFVKAGDSKSYKIVAENENINEDDIIEIDKIEIVNPSLIQTSLMEQSGNKTRPNQNTSNRPNVGTRSTVNTSPGGNRPISGGNITAQSMPPEPPEERTRVGDMNRGIISIEPTWIQVTYNDSTFMLGIKVIPIYFKDEENIVSELLKDLSRKKGLNLIFNSFKNSFISWYRKNLKSIEKFYDWMGWDLFDKNKPEGIKIKNKIIYGTTSFKRNLFLILNKNNISIDVHSTSFKNIFEILKWCSIVFMDDLNQQVSFCMKSLKGRCSVIPYRVLIHSTSNKTLGQAYKDIDDVQNAVSSVFRMSPTRITKIFGEMAAAATIINVKKHLIESVYLRESTEKYLTNPDLAIEMFKKIRFISKSSDITYIQQKLSTFPIKTPSELNSFINKNSNNFKHLYNFTKKVLKNSINFDILDDDLEILSYVIAYRSANMRGPNQIPRLRELLKEFIYDLNKNNSNDKLDKKIVLFRTIVDVFNKSTSVLKYHDFDSDEERQKIIVKNLYVFLSLVPALVLK